MADRGYVMIVHPLDEDEGGGYVAVAPDLAGCTGDGETAEAAVKDLLSAIEEWVDEAVRLGREIPAPGTYVSRAQKSGKARGRLTQAQEKVIRAQDERLTEARARAAKLVVKQSSADTSFSSWIDELSEAGAIPGKRSRAPRLPH